jgi:hypothetical protein
LGHEGRHEEAEAMHRRALEAREKVLGQDHPDTLASSFLTQPVHPEYQCPKVYIQEVVYKI